MGFPADGAPEWAGPASPGDVPVPGPPGTGAEPAGPGAGPGTGDPRVDEAVARLAGLADRPVAGHADVFEYVHGRLAEALGDLDTSGQGGPGDQAGRPGAPGR